MYRDQRGRLTVPDVMFGLFTMAFLGALYPVFSEGVEQNQSAIPTEADLLLTLLLPLLLLVFFAVIYLKAAS
jgi:hypothetical protein